ncbi:MAG TPA: DinB family protein [Pyrinomonadaceae bacterium]|jgi:uncharacterized damage-inducible protein DinB|nr:DinB family protein [Pyrinomonadaceae bacterium]
MNTLELLRDLFRHMEWADALVWRAVLSSEAARMDAVVKGRLHHSHMVQRAFLTEWRGWPHTTNAGSELELADLAEWGRDYHALASEYLATLAETSLDKPLVVPWARMVARRLGREPSAPSLGETLLQVAAHSTYHRGQINTRLRELGGEPPLTDFIAWVWSGKPSPEWPIDTE